MIMPGFFYCPPGNHYKKYDKRYIGEPVICRFGYGINISDQDQVGPVSRIFITVINFTGFEVI